MKRCTKCGELKPLDDFYRMAAMRDGHRNDCKKCNLAAKAARYRADPNPAIERAKRWAQENPEKRAAWQRAYRASGKKAANNRRSHLKRKFGLTVAQYEEMLLQQFWRCAICFRLPPEGVSLHVDHDPRTGAVRKLLCFSCNNALGDFHDDPELLQKALGYLESHEPEAAELAGVARSRALALNPR